LEDLGDVTEAIRTWLKDGGPDALVLNLPGADASVVAKTLEDPVLHDENEISLKVRLREKGTEIGEARTQVVLRRA